jgi:hypothetical protein
MLKSYIFITSAISDTKAVTLGDFEMHSAWQRTPEEWSPGPEIRVSTLNIRSVSWVLIGSSVLKFGSHEVVGRGMILIISWYVMPYNLVALYPRFGIMYFHNFGLCLLILLFSLEDDVCSS